MSVLADLWAVLKQIHVYLNIDYLVNDEKVYFKCDAQFE